MRFLYFILFVFCFNSAKSQVISGVILDAETKKPVENANLTVMNSEFRTSCNQDGSFSVNLNANKGFTVTSVGYEYMTVNLSDLNKDKLSETTIFLKPKTQLLEEVKVISSNIQYTDTKTIKAENKRLHVAGSFPPGHEICNFIINPTKNKRGRLKTLSFQVNKIEPAYDLAGFNIKFYEYDSIKKCPGDEIYTRDLIVNPENKNYRLKIDVESLKIPFPENGICISLEVVNTKHENPKQTGRISSPYIRFFTSRNKLGTAQWHKYHLIENDWRCTTSDIGSMIFDVVAKFEE